MDIPALVLRMREYWETCGVVARPGLDVATIDDWEFRHQVMLTDELRIYFTMVDGMEMHDSDNETLSFWSIDRLTSLMGGWELPSDLVNPDLYYVFSDWLFDSSHYGVRLSHDHRVAQSEVIQISGSSYVTVSKSFAQFIERYLADPISIVEPAMYGLKSR